MRIALVDTLYDSFINSLPFDASSTYESELRKVLSYKFGTFDAYSRNLAPLGWECLDVIANHSRLQQNWRANHRWFPCTDDKQVALEQIQDFTPDVVFLQDLSYFSLPMMRELSKRYILAAQCSCPWPGDDRVSMCKIAFTSFPHYVNRFEALGVRGAYLPLAFEPSVLGGDQPERDIDVSFVGGVGRESHWRQGTDVLEAVAAAFGSRFRWYGYGLGNLSPSSPLRACYRGEAFGRDMYGVYRRSKLGITRHGEVAQGYTNNLRVYEITGTGAMLLTETSSNLCELFGEYSVAAYTDAADLIYKIRHYLETPAERNFIAANGQAETLRRHTYAIRMKQVSGVLKECLESVLRK